MSKFKVGDRVAVYAQWGKAFGEIIAISCEDVSFLQIRRQSKEIIDVSWFSSKQCRRLVKKERRRVWVNPNPTPMGDFWKTRPSNNFVRTECPVNSGWIEFIEAKKK